MKRFFVVVLMYALAQTVFAASGPKPPAGKWTASGMYVFPIGPCTMIVKRDGVYWMTFPHDNTNYYSRDLASAKKIAGAHCEAWYANQMSGRRLVSEANANLEKARQRAREQEAAAKAKLPPLPVPMPAPLCTDCRLPGNEVYGDSR